MKPPATELPARYERLRLLYQVSRVIHSTLEPNRALDLIVSEAVRLMHASSGSIALLNPTSRLLETPPRAADRSEQGGDHPPGTGAGS